MQLSSLPTKMSQLLRHDLDAWHPDVANANALLCAKPKTVAVIRYKSPIFIILVSCVFQMKNHQSFGGQEVQNNRMNCVAYWIFREPS